MADEHMASRKLSPERIQDIIRHCQYYVFPGTTVTVSCLELLNGYYVIGKSACIDPNDFDEVRGMRFAREDAERQIWALEAYVIREAITNDRFAEIDKLKEQLELSKARENEAKEALEFELMARREQDDRFG